MSDFTRTPSSYMPLNLQNLFPLRSLIVTVRFLDRATPSFFHQAALTAFIRHLLGSPEDYSQYLYIDAVESGRTIYRKGDLYRFQIFILDCTAEYPKRPLELIEQLLNKLYALPNSAPITDRKAPFRNNIELYSIQDAFIPEQPITNASQCSTLEWQHIVEQACLWQQTFADDNPNSTLCWQWHTPARLLKAKDKRFDKHKDGYYCHDYQDFDGQLLLSQLFDSIATLLIDRQMPRVTRPEPPNVELQQGQVFWLNHHYKDDKGRQKSLSGISGQFILGALERLDISWWTLVVAGQYLGMGQQRTFGIGRYQIILPSGQSHYQRPTAMRSLLDTIAYKDNLAKALAHIQQSSHPSSEDDSATDASTITSPVLSFTEEPHLYLEDEDTDTEQLERLCARISEDRYQTPTLKGWIIKKSNGGVRPLAVPPFQDRVLQRATAQVLTPAFECFMHSDSYGYRPGRSRINAMQAIRQAIKEGYRWIYESDLKDFFDSINLDHLAVRLYSLFGPDPLIEQIIRWMSADVLFESELLERHKGLPQGSPLSPVLANLMLDDFDQDMSAHGFRLIRFADDFVVLCKKPEEARKAHQIAQQSLAEHGLYLNQDKTHIRSSDQGIRFLGYLFVNDMAIDVGGSKLSIDSSEPTELVSPNSWLAHLSEHKLHALTGKEEPDQLKQFASPTQQPEKVGERDESGAVLAITGSAPCTLYTRQERLQIERDDQLIVNMPWRHIQALVLFGNHHITTPAIKAAMSFDVAIHLANGMGKYQGTCWNGQAPQGHTLWLQQQAAFTDPTHSLELAKATVKARIHHCNTVLKRRQLDGGKQLSLLTKELEHAKDLTQLNGYEGAAARVYFQSLAHYLPSEFAFTGRNRRPPKDPFNVMLSLGYTLLYGYVDSLIRVSGLLPTIGFYHQPHGRHSGLASDLMEPFRHIVERTALAMIRKGQIKSEYFNTTEDGCIMDKKAVRLYLTELTCQFETPQPVADNYLQQWGSKITSITLESNEPKSHPSIPVTMKDKRRLTDLILQQNQSLKRFITSGETFTPWRQR